MAKLVEKNRALEQRVQELEVEVAQLKARTQRNSRNSNAPPSTDGPKARAKRRKKARSHRKKGAQPGHKGTHRRHLVADHKLHMVPSHCKHCHHQLEGQDLNPVVHQVVDIPPIKPVVTDYHLHRLGCQCCGKTTRAQLPDGMPAVHYGPRLRALLATLVVAYRISRRQVQRFAQQVCEVSISLGTVSNLEKHVCEALEPVVTEAHEHLCAGSALYVDETGMGLEGGKGGYLWVSTDSQVALFVIDPSRSRRALNRLTQGFEGVLISDRFSAYRVWPLEMRQFCWAHLLRAFEALSQQAGAAGRIGSTLLKVGQLMFRVLRWNRAGIINVEHTEIARVGEKFRGAMRYWLEEASKLPRPPSWASSLLEDEDAMWKWLEVEGLEPTNNCAERALRHAVIWRRISYGVESQRGARFAERMLTVVQSLRAQGRAVFPFLRKLLTIGHQNPSLLPSPS